MDRSPSQVLKSEKRARAASTTFKSHIAPSLLLLLQLRHVRSKRKEGVRAGGGFET